MSINATATNAFASFDLFICLIIMVLSSFLQYGATTISKCFCELPLMSLLKYQNLIDLYLNSFLSLNSILSLQKTMNQRFLSILNSKKTTHTHRQKKSKLYVPTYVLSTVSLSVCTYVNNPVKCKKNSIHLKNLKNLSNVQIIYQRNLPPSQKYIFCRSNKSL